MTATTTASAKARRRPTAPRARDPAARRARNLAAAKVEFARRGLAGARVDLIAARARINQHTRSVIYGFDLGAKDALERRCAVILDVVLCHLQLRPDIQPGCGAS